MKKIILLSAVTFLICTFSYSQNLILNGSFENNSASGNSVGLTSTWSSIVADSYEVDGGTMDLITTNNCGTASEGNWFVTCSAMGIFPWPYLAFSLKLSTTLTIGAQYTITFDKRFCGPNSSPVDIAITDDSTLLGTVVHTFAAPTLNSWTTETYVFQAPVAANYLVVNIGVTGSTGTVGLDNFILEAGATGINEYANGNIKIFINPFNDLLTISSNAITKADVEIYTVTGNRIYQSVNENQIDDIDLSSMSSGIYFVRIINERKSYVVKIILR